MQRNQLTPQDWHRYKVIRLAALKESPEAFGSTFEKENAFVDEVWITRLSRTDSVNFVASDDFGDIGLITSAPYAGHVGLFAMWVSPSARGRGVGGKLIDAVISWARSQGFEKLILDVNDNNAPAIALYQSKGFAANDITSHMPAPNEHITDLQMELVL